MRGSGGERLEDMNRPPRLRRSIISVPANSEKMLGKAPGLAADVVMLDLEDSVPVDQKERARSMAAECLKSGNWGAQVRSVRINDMSTPFAYRDLIEVVEAAGDCIDTIVVPKVNDPAEIKAIDYFLMQIESAMGFEPERIGLEASIETAEGMLEVEDIAYASTRLETLVFGIADYTSSLGMLSKGTSGHGDAEEFYPGHRYHFPLSRIAMAAKAAGLAAIDAPYGDFKNPDGLRQSCLLSAALGFDGKWAIHPSQIEIINETYSPSPEDVERARRVVEAFEKAVQKGRGAVSLDGKMVDAASIRVARTTLAHHAAIAGKEG